MSADARGDTSGQAQAAPLGQPEDWIEYGVGLATFRGRTTVRIRGDGHALVRFERGEQVDRYEGRLDDAKLGGIRRTLASQDLRTLTSTRNTAQPDEPRIKVTLHGRGGDVMVEAWQNDQWSNPSLRALVVMFQEVAKQVSGGKVTH